MEKNEEMVIMKSDLAIAVKKDGTFIINNPQMQNYVKLYEGIADYLKNSREVCVAEFCIGELIGHKAIEKVISDRTKEIEDRKRQEEKK